MMGRPLNTLEAVASGAVHVPMALDHMPESPQPATVDAASLATR